MKAVGEKGGEGRGKIIAQQPVIVPKRGHFAVPHSNGRDALVSGEFSTDEAFEIGVTAQTRGVRKKPAFPGRKAGFMEFVNEFHE